MKLIFSINLPLSFMVSLSLAIADLSSTLIFTSGFNKDFKVAVFGDYVSVNMICSI